MWYRNSIPVLVRLRKPDGSWTKKIQITFDTGANVSLLPKYLGSQLSVRKYVPYKLTGIAKKKECLIPVRITRITMRMEDPYGNTSPQLQIWTAIAHRDDVPMILGMKEIINNFKFESSPTKKEFYLTWKS